MKKIITSIFLSCLTAALFGQANTYFHDRIDTTLFAIADTVGHGANHYYATNLTPDFNVKQYVNGCTVNLFFKKGNTGSATLTLVTKTATLSSKTIRKANGQVLLSGDIPDSTAVILDYYNGSFRIAGIGVTASSSSWLLTGNSGTTAGTNFLGTTDAVDLVLKTNNTEKARISSAGILSLGLASTNNGSLLFRNSTNANTLTINSGVTSASYALTLPTAQGAANSLLLNNGAGTLSWNSGTGLFWALNGNTVGSEKWMGTADNYSLPFRTNNTERMIIDSTGLIGVNSDPTATTQFFIRGAANNYAFRVDANDGGSHTNALVVRKEGYVGIGIDPDFGFDVLAGGGTAFIQSNLQLANTNTAAHCIFSMGETHNSITPFYIDRYGSTTGSPNLVEINNSGSTSIQSAGNVKIFLASSGYVGLGAVTTPTCLFDMKGISDGTTPIFRIKENTNTYTLFSVINDSKLTRILGGTDATALEVNSVGFTAGTPGTLVPLISMYEASNFHWSDIAGQYHNTYGYSMVFKVNETTTGSPTERFRINQTGAIASVRVQDMQGADVASLNGAIAVGYDGNVFELTGTNSVTLLSNLAWQNGSEVTFVFTSTATIVDGTANSGTDIGFECAGNANFVGSADDVITFVLSEIGGTVRWREKSRSVN